MPPSKSVSVHLDKPRTLRYTMRAMEKIEEETGKSVTDEAFLQGISATDLITVVWAGLIHEDRDVERDVVLDHVDVHSIEDVAEKVRAAMGVASEGDEDGADEEGGGESPKA